MTNQGRSRLIGVDTSGNGRSTTVNESRKGGRNTMERSMSVRSASLGRRHAKMAMGLLVLFAAAIIISGIALAPISKERALKPAENLANPGAPHTVLGQSFAASGAPEPSTTITITDLRTMLSKTYVTDPTYGGYLIDLGEISDWLPTDEIQITGEKGVMTGLNSTFVGGGGKTWLNVTLNVLIPEFPMVIVPVLGMMGLFAVVAVRSRIEEQ